MPETTVTRLELLADRRAEFERRIAQIDEARGFVLLTTYFVDEDDYAARILDALMSACRRGVRVFLGTDAFGQRLGRQILDDRQQARLARRFADLSHAGATVRFHRPRTRLQRALGGGQHIKVQLSEDGCAILGSSNISARSFAPTAWKEVSFAVSGAAVMPVFESIGAVFPGAIDDHERKTLLGVCAREIIDATAINTVDVVWHDPNVHPWAPLVGVRNPLTDRLVRLIDGAQRRLAITSFYFKPAPALAHAVLRAAKRGVHVEIFHSGRTALVESDLPWLCAAIDYPSLHAAGVVIRESARGEHSKIVLVDDNEVAIGSYNFEHAAHDRLAELMLFTRAPAFIADVERALDDLRADTDNAIVDPRTPMSWRMRARMALWAPVRRWF